MVDADTRTENGVKPMIVTQIHKTKKDTYYRAHCHTGAVQRGTKPMHEVEIPFEEVLEEMRRASEAIDAKDRKIGRLK